jgi:predicted flap endonuclease-1-like 5' DNA nuclease
MKIAEIEGIGEVYAEKLASISVTTVNQLLKKGSTANGRKELADKTGISDTLILKWVNRADLFRVKGIGTQYSDLLEAAGVDTVVELATRKSENLHAKMVEVNQSKKVVRQLPTVKQVTEWVESAKTLPRAINY